MALHTKKLYFRRNGVTESVNLYNSPLDTGSTALVLRDGATNVYAGLVPTTSPDASNLRAMTGGQTLAIAKQMMIWKWAAAAGGTSYDYSYAIAIDSSGNCYVTGYFNGTATFGSTSLTSSGNTDIFVAKLNTSGVWQWAVKAGGTNIDSGRSIAVDSSGNCYVTGNFGSTATFGSISLTSSGNNDIFVAKLDTSGVWQWAVKAGGLNNDYSYAIAVDSSGNCYVTGDCLGSVTFGSINLPYSASTDTFVAKLNTSGVWQWAVRATGTSDDHGYGIAVDSSGNCYVTGYFNGTATFGSTSITSSGDNDIFVAKLNTSGVWQWAAAAGGTSLDYSYAITVDSSGNCYVTGYFNGTATFGSTSLTSSGNTDIFVAKLNTSGVWQWAVKAGGASADSGQGIAADSSGNCYVAGEFVGTATFGSISLPSSGYVDIFVAKLNTSGVWQWAVKAGGVNNDYGRGIAVDSSGNCYVTGNFGSTATFGSISPPSSGYVDIFVAKLGY